MRRTGGQGAAPSSGSSPLLPTVTLLATERLMMSTSSPSVSFRSRAALSRQVSIKTAKGGSDRTRALTVHVLAGLLEQLQRAERVLGGQVEDGRLGLRLDELLEAAEVKFLVLQLQFGKIQRSPCRSTALTFFLMAV